MIKGTLVGHLLKVILARKPASMYRRVKGPAYTRRKFIGGVPNNRILQFHIGNRKAAETGCSMLFYTDVDNAVQVRHTALEAGRVIANATIRKEAGTQGYACVYTHTLITYSEKQAVWGCADRASRKRCAFGNRRYRSKAKRNQTILSIQTT